MATKIALTSFKGGVYKTSTAVSISICLSKLLNKRVLIIDCDLQNNVILNFKNVKQSNKNLYELIIKKDFANALDYCINVYENIDVLQNSLDSLNLDYNIYTNPSKYKNPLKIFNEFISILEFEYDYIIYDLSAYHNLLNLNALLNTDFAIILTENEVFSIKNLVKNIELLNDLNIEILGILETKVKKNTKVYKEIHNQLVNQMSILEIPVFKNKIETRTEQPLNLLLKNENILISNMNKQTSFTYKNLTREILNEIEMKKERADK